MSWRRRSRFSRYDDEEYGGWAPYVPVAERKRKAEKLAAKLVKQGQVLSPVSISGRAMAKTFWGKAWCEQCESFSDFSNRLDRGKRYARNGSILDLQIQEGEIVAMVSGSEVYHLRVSISPLPKKEWSALVKRCHGSIRSAMDLLLGRLDEGVLAALTDRKTGILPRRKEISLDCDCPDFAVLCKHLAAVLYGVGARLDEDPGLLFVLRGVDRTELLDESLETGTRALLDTQGASRLEAEDSDLGALFGIDLGEEAVPPPARASKAKSKPSARPGRSARPAAKTVAKVPAVPKRAPAPARKAKVTPLPPRLPRTVRPADLLAWGIPRSTFQNWVGTEILERTEERGVYRVTRRTRAWLKEFLARD